MNKKTILKKIGVLGLAGMTLTPMTVNSTYEIQAARVHHKYSNATIAKAKKRMTSARKKYNEAKKYEDKLKKKLNKAKKSTVSDVEIEEAEADLTVKQSQLSAAQDALKWDNVNNSNDLNKAKENLKNAQNKLNSAQAALNKISAQSSKVVNIGESQLIHFPNTADKNFYANSVHNVTYGNSQIKNKLTQISRNLYLYNRENYASSPNDTQTVDLNNLSNSQAEELNKFTLRALNSARRSVGSPEFVLSQSAMNMSKDVATEYHNDNWDYYGGHDVQALSRVSNKYGIKNWPGENTIENMQGKTITVYKNDTYSGLPSGLDHAVNMSNPFVMTMKDAKTLMYESIELLLFNGGEWAHADSLLFGNQKYFGLSLEPLRNNLFRVHIITIRDSDILNGSRFDRHAITNVPGTALNLGSVKLRGAGYNDALKKVNDAKAEVQTAQNKVSELERSKASTNTNSKAQQKVDNAQLAVDEAQAYLDRLEHDAKKKSNKETVSLLNKQLKKAKNKTYAAKKALVKAIFNYYQVKR